jgi:hypothetical protein
VPRTTAPASQSSGRAGQRRTDPRCSDRLHFAKLRPETQPPGGLNDRVDERPLQRMDDASTESVALQRRHLGVRIAGHLRSRGGALSARQARPSRPSTWNWRGTRCARPDVRAPRVDAVQFADAPTNPRGGEERLHARVVASYVASSTPVVVGVLSTRRREAGAPPSGNSRRPAPSTSGWIISRNSSISSCRSSV